MEYKCSTGYPSDGVGRACRRSLVFSLLAEDKEMHGA
jgi:hypothetical protein